jgi:hypothetical protein
MESYSHTRVISALVLVSSLIISLLFSTPARAEYVPQYTSIGKVITVGVCLPNSVKSPIYLQTYYDSFSNRKTVAKISFSKLAKHSDCDFYSGIPAFAGSKMVEVGPRLYRLTYKWKVSVTGESLLNFYSPNMKLSFDGWPDGVISKKAATTKPTTRPQDAFLNQPAADYFIPGSALTTLQQVWGISLNGASGPKTFSQVADEIYLYLNRSVGGNLSANDLEISFQYGNSMQVFFSRLIDNVWAYQAMKDRLIYNANL